MNETIQVSDLFQQITQVSSTSKAKPSVEEWSKPTSDIPWNTTASYSPFKLGSFSSPFITQPTRVTWSLLRFLKSAFRWPKKKSTGPVAKGA